MAWYRFRATFRRKWRGYASLAILIGAVGGLSLAALAAARKTQSSFPAYLASTNPSDLNVATAVLNPDAGSNVGYDPAVLAAIARLPHVKKIVSMSGLDVLPLGPDGTPIDMSSLQSAAGNGAGSDDGAFFSQDRVTATEGRVADPARADEIVMQTAVAHLAGFHVGQRIAMGIYTNAQTQLPDFGTAAVPPYRRVDVTLVGTGLASNELVADETDHSTSLAVFTPAFTRPLLDCCSNYTQTGIQVEGGGRNIAAVGAAVQRLLPNGFPPPTVTSDGTGKAERAIKPESLALGVFAGIAGLAALLIAGQVIGRQLRLDGEDVATMRALGASPGTTSSDGLIGVLVAVGAGSALALGVAFALSPLAPIGPVRRVDPRPALAFDWTVLGLGLVVLVSALSGLALIVGFRGAPHRVASRQRRAGSRGSSTGRLAARSGLPVPAVAGIHFALEPGAARDAVPVRSAIFGSGLAILVLVGTLTFGASLHALVTHPALYGWNWDYLLVAGGAAGNMAEQPATQLLNADPHIRAWSGAYSVDLVLDGQTVPVLGEHPKSAVQPPILSGHGLDGPDQLVLGALTLKQLHKHVGDTVEVTGGANATTRLKIVGTSAMPAVGGSGGPHLEMGAGALLDDALIPATARNPFNDPESGPQLALVRLRPGSNHAAALRSLQGIATALSNNFNFGVGVTPVFRPAEIVNYRAISATPAILGAALGLGAAVALALTLVAAVRRRRRDLALLKTLGFTRRQLAAVVAWQSTIAVAIGGLAGIPLGIVAGRLLWSAFANEIHAVPTPTVPGLSIVLVGVGALVLANLVAAIPGRVAARTPAALALRAE